MPSKNADRLVELSKILDFPASAFHDEELMPQHRKETAEMLRLWFEIGPSEDREQLLTMARNLVSTQQERLARRYK